MELLLSPSLLHEHNFKIDKSFNCFKCCKCSFYCLFDRNLFSSGSGFESCIPVIIIVGAGKGLWGHIIVSALR